MMTISEDLILLVARVCLSAVFLVSGIHKSIYFQAAREEFQGAKVPAPDVCLVLVIALHLVCSFSLITGVYTDIAAMALAAFMVLVTLWVHRFWSRPAEEQLKSSRDFLANLGIIGGLLFMIVVGPGQYVLG